MIDGVVAAWKNSTQFEVPLTSFRARASTPCRVGLKLRISIADSLDLMFVPSWLFKRLLLLVKDVSQLAE